MPRNGLSQINSQITNIKVARTRKQAHLHVLNKCNILPRDLNMLRNGLSQIKNTCKAMEAKTHSKPA
jgi:hypothetical protein